MRCKGSAEAGQESQRRLERLKELTSGAAVLERAWRGLCLICPRLDTVRAKAVRLLRQAQRSHCPGFAGPGKILLDEATSLDENFAHVRGNLRRIWATAHPSSPTNHIADLCDQRILFSTVGAS